MSEKNQDEAMRMIHNGILNQTSEYNPYSLTTFYAINETSRVNFSETTPLELATLAARLLPHCKNAKTACMQAAELIRESTVEINRQKNEDERNRGMLEHNDSNRRIWKTLGKELEKIAKRKKGNADDLNYPFPITEKELFAVLKISPSTGYGRIKKLLPKMLRDRDPTASDEDISNNVKEIRKRGIYQPLLIMLSKDWPEVTAALKRWRIEK